METPVKLRELLLNAESFPWGDTLYMSSDEVWSLDSDCWLFDLDEILEPDEDDPQFAIENNLQCVLNIADIQDIVDNLKQQKIDYSAEELLEAFLFYFDNDAFIDIEG